MKYRLVILVFLSAAIGFGWSVDLRADDSANAFFETKIRPVLAEHCYKCHSATAKTVQGGLRVDSREGIRGGGDSGPAVVPGKLDESLIVAALRYESLEMPPDGKLPDAVIADFVKWIEMGAPDPRVANPSQASSAQRPGKLWSFQPIQVQMPAAIGDTSWASGKIDQFVLARLEAKQLVPVSDAPPEKLARRLYFDLVGLPPDPERVDLFVEHARKGRAAAIGQLVDDLLASPHFGERFGRRWLDLVRFSETNGGDRNVIYPHAWRYRDYVIDAFNDDKPFDRFVLEQLAGDTLTAASPAERDAGLIATGMLTLGPKLFMETDAERFRMDRVDEQIDVLSRAVLGLTVSCARCHDHKFDPVTTRDYYALAGIFRSTRLLYGPAAPAGNQYGHDRALQPIGPDGEKLQGPAEAWTKQIAEKTSQRNKARSDRYRVVRKKAALDNQLKMKSAGKNKAELADDEAIAKLKQELNTLTAEIAEWDKKIEVIVADLEKIENNPPPLPDYCMAVRDDETCEDCRICVRGDVKRRGDAVARGFVAALNLASASQPTIPADQSGRRQLAEWLTDPRHPLTSRVFVNRVWGHLFGKGLVPTVDNFGHTGELPSHPALLDYLARKFVDDGWSVKRLVRRIVQSRAYQLDSRPIAAQHQIDPENRLLWRQNARRLEVESLRDSVLAASGALDRQPPRGSVVSAIGERELNARVRLPSEYFQTSKRTVYLPVARFHLPEIFKAFDFADPNLVVGRREQRTMVGQQLFLLNDPWILDQSDLAARRLLADADDDTARVELAYRRFFGRSATGPEREAALSFVTAEAGQAAQPLQAKQPSAPQTTPSQRQPANGESPRAGSDRPSERFASGEVVAWTQFCQALVASSEFRIIE